MKKKIPGAQGPRRGPGNGGMRRNIGKHKENERNAPELLIPNQFNRQPNIFFYEKISHFQSPILDPIQTFLGILFL